MSGYFRDDRFNAADPIQNRVLPYSNQQFSTTYGGPILQDRFHYFANFEYERELYVRTYSSPFARFNIDQPGTRTEKKGGVRLDYQFSSRTRLTARLNVQRSYDPLDARWSGGNLHPASATAVPKESESIANRLTHVIGDRAVNELAVNWNRYHWKTQPIVNWPNHPLAPFGMTNGSPTIQLQGYRIGQQHNRSPQILTEKGPSLATISPMGSTRVVVTISILAPNTSTAASRSSLASTPTAFWTRRADRFRPTSRSCFQCGTTFDLEPQRAQLARAVLPARRRQLRVEQSDHERGRLGAGRLDNGPPDAQSRRALRHHQGHVR